MRWCSFNWSCFFIEGAAFVRFLILMMTDCICWCRKHLDNVWPEDEVLKLAAAVESNTVHPVGKAIVEAAQAVKCPNIKVLFHSGFCLDLLLIPCFDTELCSKNCKKKNLKNKELWLSFQYYSLFLSFSISNGFSIFSSFQAVHQLTMTAIGLGSDDVLSVYPLAVIFMQKTILSGGGWNIYWGTWIWCCSCCWQ